MQVVSDVRRAFVVGGILCAVVLALALPPDLASAVEDATDDGGTSPVPGARLPDGEWIGSFDASGAFAGDFEGSTADVDVVVRGSLGFDAAGGVLDGEWSFWALQSMRLQTPGGPGTALFVSQGDGAVDGSGRTVRMTGQNSTTGTVVIAGRAQSVGPNQHVTGPLEVQVAFEGCGLVVGDWITPLSALMDTTGLTGSLEGSFAAAYQGEQSDLLERFDQLRLDMNVWERDLLETSDPDPVRATDLINRIYALEYQVRQGVDDCLFDTDGDREEFSRFLTAAARDLLWLFLTTNEPGAANLDDSITLSLDFGIVGSGASDQGTAADFVAEIQDHVNRILAEQVLVQTDGVSPATGASCSSATPCVGLNPEAQQALRAAARLGLDIEIAGQQGSAQQTLDAMDANEADEETDQ